jgi:hypothetical protein
MTAHALKVLVGTDGGSPSSSLGHVLSMLIQVSTVFSYHLEEEESRQAGISTVFFSK